MFGDSEVTSERTLSVRMGSDDDLTSQSRLKYMLEGSSVFERELASDPSFEEASPFGQCPKEIVLLDNWSVHDFPIDMRDKVFCRLRLTFKFLMMCPLRRATEGKSVILGACRMCAFMRLPS